jgi:acyl-CoA reductase-like NAD-dependent aldehyde dehydrogenase
MICFCFVVSYPPLISLHTIHSNHGSVAWGTFLNSGQTCVRPDFCLVADDVADKFLEVLKKTVTSFYGEDPQKTEWFGRCINTNAFERLTTLVANREKVLNSLLMYVCIYTYY